MDIQRVNTVLNRAIVALQEGEIEAIIEKAMAGTYAVPSPAKFGMGYKPKPPSAFGFEPEPVELHDAKDATKDVLDKVIYTWNRYGSTSKEFGGKITPAKGKLNKSQQVVMDFVGKGIDLPFISNVVLFADELRRFNKNQKKALISLLMGGKLKIYIVSGPLPGEHKPSKVGARADSHYRLVKASAPKPRPKVSRSKKGKDYSKTLLGREVLRMQAKQKADAAKPRDMSMAPIKRKNSYTYPELFLTKSGHYAEKEAVIDRIIELMTPKERMIVHNGSPLMKDVFKKYHIDKLGFEWKRYFHGSLNEFVEKHGWGK